MKNVTYTFLLFIFCSIYNLNAQHTFSSIELEPLEENTIHSEFGVTPYLDGYIFASNFKDYKKATKDYLISKGIKASRLTGRGYGETKLINNCANNVNCSEEEHALNRRSEFIVVK